MKHFLLAGFVAAAAMATPASAAWVYLGSWYVGDGPLWTDNPPVMSGLDVAAMKWPGWSAYAISTIDANPANINFSAFVDGWADPTFLTTPVAQGFKLDTGGGGYNSNPGFGTAYSAWVLDHSCFNRYDDITAVCGPGEPGLNHAFGMVVPEPGTWAMLIAGFGLVGTAVRRRKAIAA
jgi:hypothetical protein